MALTTIHTNFRRTGAGKLYLAAAPTSSPGSGFSACSAGYFNLFMQDGNDLATLKAGVEAWCDLTEDGLQLKIKEGNVEFAPNAGPKQKKSTGIEEATGEASLFDIDPLHIADMFGLAASEILAQAPASGKPGRKIVGLGSMTSKGNFVAMFRMASPIVPGAFDAILLPNVQFIVDSDLKFAKKDKLEGKVQIQLLESPYLVNAEGNGVVAIYNCADAPGL